MFFLTLIFSFFYRYGVRGCFRHLCYLEDLLEKCEKHQLIDPTLIHFSYAFCASHVHGNRYGDKIGPKLFLKQKLIIKSNDIKQLKWTRVNNTSNADLT